MNESKSNQNTPKKFDKQTAWLLFGAAVGGILGILAYNNGWI